MSVWSVLGDGVQLGSKLALAVLIAARGCA
jgi:hypothetical protein